MIKTGTANPTPIESILNEDDWKQIGKVLINGRKIFIVMDSGMEVDCADAQIFQHWDKYKRS